MSVLVELSDHATSGSSFFRNVSMGGETWVVVMILRLRLRVFRENTQFSLYKTNMPIKSNIKAMLIVFLTLIELGKLSSCLGILLWALNIIRAS